jgi:hypothetical protein
MSDKQAILQTVGLMPDGASWEGILDELALQAELKASRTQADAGELIPLTK